MKTVLIYGGRTFTEEELRKKDDVARGAVQLHSTILDIRDSRERALALTKLEECIMWTSKAIKTGGLFGSPATEKIK